MSRFLLTLTCFLLLAVPLGAQTQQDAERLKQFVDRLTLEIDRVIGAGSPTRAVPHWNRVLDTIEAQPDEARAAFYLIEHHLSSGGQPGGQAQTAFLNILARAVEVRLGDSSLMSRLRGSNLHYGPDKWEDTPLAYDGKLERARVYVAVGDYARALDTYGTHPGGVDVLAEAAGIAEAHDPGRADLKALESALEGTTSDAQRLSLLLAAAGLHRLGGGHDRAVTHYAEALKLANKLEGPDALLARFVADTWSYALGGPSPSPVELETRFGQAWRHLEQLPDECTFKAGQGSRILPAARFWLKQSGPYGDVLQAQVKSVRELDRRLVVNPEFQYAWLNLLLDAVEQLRQAGESGAASDLLDEVGPMVDQTEAMVREWIGDNQQVEPGEILQLRARLVELGAGPRR